jgi:alkanesulfonate monooxygenase SsuD/methylene tetrahydromethanopterin reductase-like flavin-dependent oxidoreductase (luciferase family)
MLHLAVSLAGSGFHPASWHVSRLPPAPGIAGLYPIAQTAERGCLDAILLGHRSEGATIGSIGRANTMQLDPLPLAGALIARTRRIGVAAGWTVDFTEPFHVARVLATLDHLSYGRAAWLVQMFGTEVLKPRIGRPTGTETQSEYCRRAGEFIQAVEQLWDSWEDEAFAVDKASGMFVDPDRVHRIDHQGRHFTIRGPLNVPRPPQGYPVLVQSDPGNPERRQLVAATADVILTGCESAADAAASYRDLHRLAAEQGRDPCSFRILADLCIVLASTEAAARQRAAQLDSVVPPGSVVPRFVGTPAALVELFAGWSADRACDGFNLLPAVLPDDLDLLVDAAIPMARARHLFRTAYAGATLRDHFGLPRPVSQYTEIAG